MTTRERFNPEGYNDKKLVDEAQTLVEAGELREARYRIAALLRRASGTNIISPELMKQSYYILVDNSVPHRDELCQAIIGKLHGTDYAIQPTASSASFESGARPAVRKAEL